MYILTTRVRQCFSQVSEITAGIDYTKAFESLGRSTFEANINCVDSVSELGFPDVDIPLIVIEYKQNATGHHHHLCQLAMSMATAVHQLRTLGLKNVPVFGLLVEGAAVSIYIGYMPEGTWSGTVDNLAEVLCHVYTMRVEFLSDLSGLHRSFVEYRLTSSVLAQSGFETDASSHKGAGCLMDPGDPTKSPSPS